jgi:hypothetical protein
MHSGPICCEQAGTASNCYSATATAQSFMGGWGGGPGHYVVTTTRVEVELGCDNSKSMHNFTNPFNLSQPLLSSMFHSLVFVVSLIAVSCQ